MKKAFSLVSVDNIPFRVFYGIDSYPLEETHGRPTMEIELHRITHGKTDDDLLPLLSDHTVELIEAELLEENATAMLSDSEE